MIHDTKLYEVLDGNVQYVVAMPKRALPSKTIPYYTLHHTLQLYMIQGTVLCGLCLVLCFIARPLFTRESAAVGRAPSFAKPARGTVVQQELLDGRARYFQSRASFKPLHTLAH